MMPYNNYYPFFMVPFIPPNCDKPPTVYTILESIVNGTKEPEMATKIKDLAKEGRSIIFDFDYPLSEHVNKEDFEIMILKHYMTRRIGFDTVTLFKLQLDAKLNEIMPMYNRMLDMLNDWNVFEDGYKQTRYGYDNRITDGTNETENTLKNNSETETKDISDRRFSDLPQSELENIKDASYVTEYNYDQANKNSKDNSTSNGNSKATNHGTDNKDYKETIERTNYNDEVTKLKTMQESIKSIYSLIFKDLDLLFYSIY